MKIALLFIFFLSFLTACTHGDDQFNASEIAAITASDVQSSHINTVTTLDQITKDMPPNDYASASITQTKTASANIPDEAE